MRLSACASEWVHACGWVALSVRKPARVCMDCACVGVSAHAHMCVCVHVRARVLCVVRVCVCVNVCACVCDWVSVRVFWGCERVHVACLLCAWMRGAHA